MLFNRRRNQSETPVETTPEGEVPAAEAPRHSTAPATEGPAGHGTAPVTETAATRRIAGGGAVGSGLCGYAAALGFYVIVATIVGAVVTKIGTTSAMNIGGALNVARVTQVKPVTWADAIALIVLAFLAFAVGGYVAGTMARVAGLAHGIAVWFWGAVAAVVASLIVELASSRYAGLYQLDLFPRIHVGSGTGMTAAIISAIIFAAAGLLGALIGGGIGAAAHRRVRVTDPRV